MSFFGGGFPFGFGGEEHFDGFPGGKKSPGPVDNKRYYEVLEVDQKASAEEIRKAYRKKALKLHPDKGGSQELFQELQHAYDVLSDPEKRELYNKYGEEGLKDGAGGESGDIFDLLMNRGGGGRGAPKRKTKSVLHTLKVTLEDVYKGTQKYLQISRYRICTGCKGNGSKDPNVNTKCTGCAGKGVKMIVRQIQMGIIQQQVTCSDCKGEGFVIKEKDKCTLCKAQKVVQTPKNLEIQLDKGIPDGHKYTFKGESDEVPDVEAGDVIVEIVIEKHKKFTRKGGDLVYHAEITLVEALSGFEMIVEHLDGRKIHLQSQTGEIVKPGDLKTVKECGMPFFTSPFRFGNLFIQFNVVFPKKVSEDQKIQLAQLFPEMVVKKKLEKCEENYNLTDFKMEDENTHHTGGKKDTKSQHDPDNEEDEQESQQNVRCQHQ